MDKFAVHPRPLVLDAILLFLQNVGGERIGQEGLNKFAAFPIEDLKARAESVALCFVLFVESARRFLQGNAHIIQVQVPVRLSGASAKLNDLDPRVLGGHQLLDLFRWDIGQLAAGPLDPTEAGEVVVATPGLALSLDEGHALAAEVAAQAPLQVVVVLAVALTGHRVGIENFLNDAEGQLVDQRLMLSVWVFRAAVAHGADVVGVDQEAGELGARQGTAALLGGAANPQTAFLKFGA